MNEHLLFFLHFETKTRGRNLRVLTHCISITLFLLMKSYSTF